MNTASFAPRRRRRLLALGTAAALAIVAASPALAQDAKADNKDKDIADTPADPEPGDQIIVTGNRATLQSAQNIKRNADTFVDVISAEDIGALPDRSVAEALQRMPGVNIGRFEKPSDPDRFSVEGTSVIIRSLNFVCSELNGRDIFSANGGTVLNFNEVSPELLGRVEVLRTSLLMRSKAGSPGRSTSSPASRSTGAAFTLRARWKPTSAISPMNSRPAVRCWSRTPSRPGLARSGSSSAMHDRS